MRLCRAHPMKGARANALAPEITEPCKHHAVCVQIQPVRQKNGANSNV